MEKLTLLFLKLKDKGFFHLIVSNYSVQFIVFASSLLVAKIMSPSSVGIIKTIETFANMAIVLGSGGVIFAILKVIPENKDVDIRKVALLFSFKYAAVFSLIIFILFNLLGYFGLISQDEILLHWFYQYSFIIVPSVLTALLIRYYQAIDRFKRISAFVFYLKLLTAIFVLFFTYFFFIKGYVLSMVITTILTTLVLLYDLRKEFVNNEIINRAEEIKNKIIGLSKTAFIAQLIDQFKMHSGFLIANYVILDRELFGNYAFALILIQGIGIVSSTVQQFVIPKMSESSNDLTIFFQKHRKFEKQFVYFATIIFIGAQLFLPIVVGLVFGDKYDNAIPVFRIMLIGWLVESFYTLKGIVFLSLGKMKYISFASIIIFLISCPAIYFLNVYYGIIGAGVAYVFQNCISLLVLIYFTRKVAKQSAHG